MVAIKAGDIVFSRSNSMLSKIVRIRTLSQWSRVGIVTGKYEGSIKCISARYSGVVYDSLNNWVGDIQILRIRDISNEQINKMISYVTTQVGKYYGILGFLDLLFFQKCQYKHRWFSSSLIHSAMLRSGIDPCKKKSNFITPGDLYESPRLEFITEIN